MAQDRPISKQDFGAAYGDKDHIIAQLIAILDHTPRSINLWNNRFESIYCNQHAVELFGFESKEAYMKGFGKLAPEKQPDGTPSSIAAAAHIEQVRKEGVAIFNWLHRKLDGEEVPSEVCIYRLDFEDEEPHFVSFVRDLRSQLAGYGDGGLSDGFFFNYISDRTLLSAVAELSDEWFWVYDIESACIQFFGKGRAILNLSGDKQPFPKGVLEAGLVHPDDLNTFLDMAKAMTCEFERPYDVRFILPDGSARYFRVTFKTVCDKEGKPRFNIGKTFDIHEQKMLETMSRTDLLTGCLNKMTTEMVIKEALVSAKNGTHALFIIDIDNFKAVNDNLGHHFGDVVLSDIAMKLHHNFRGEDVIGRIGGDEFVVFIQNVADPQVIAKKAQAMAESFKNTYAGEQEDYKISGSIGIALYPKDGNSYEALYKAADKALYQSKIRGKDCYTLYSDELVDGTMETLTIVENANRLASSYFDADLVSTIFDLMYEANDACAALNTVLQWIGKRLHVDRCYIFESFGDGERYSVTYEWCHPKVSPQIQNLQNMKKEQLHDLFEVLDKNGVLYSNDLALIESEAAYAPVRGQGIKAFLLVKSKGKLHNRLVLGLDDCKSPRVWSEKEINSVSYALKMISIFMSSSRRSRQALASLPPDLSAAERELIAGLEARGIGLCEL